MKGTKKWGREVWLRVLTFVLLSIVKHQTAKIISNTENFWSFLEQYIANIFFPCGYRHSIYNITYHTSQRPPFPSKVNETWAGSQPFQYGLGDCHPTQNANPQTLPSLGCLRIVYIVQKEYALGLKSSPSRSCCRTSLPRWCRSAGRC